MKVGKLINLPALLFAVLFMAGAPLVSAAISIGGVNYTAIPAANAQTTAGPSDKQIQAEAEKECGTSTTDRRIVACRGGFKAGVEGSPSKATKCNSYPTPQEKTRCEEGYDAGKTYKANFGGGAPGGGTTGGGASGGAAGGAGTDPDIEESDTGCGTDFDWVLCKIIRGASDTVGWIEDTIIEPFLDITPLLFTANPIYDIWKVMRDLANALFVLVFLVFIFAQTLSLNLDAYAIRKIIPKLVAAAILVQLSYLLASLAIDIFNVLGHGLYLLANNSIPPVSPNAQNSQGGSFLNLAFLAGGAAALAVSAAVSVSIVPVMIGIVLAALAVFFTLIFRQILVVLLIVVAPLAIVAWVLPGTEKLFKKWLDLFLKVLVMYPIIVMLFAAGKLFAASAYATNATFAPLFALVGIMVSLFVVPFSAKFAGGVIGTVGALSVKRGAALGKKVGGSQWAKDRAEQKKEDASLKYKDLENQKGLGAFLGRRRARGMAGGSPYFGSAAATRRLNKGYDKAEKDQIDAHTIRMESDASLGTSDLVKIAKGVSTKGYEPSKTMQMAAIRTMAKTRQIAGLREVRDHIANTQAGLPPNSPQSLSMDTMYKRAINPEFGDILKAAPDLITPPSTGTSMGANLDSIAGVNPEGLSGLNKDTIDHFMQHANDTQKKRLMQTIIRTYNSPNAKNKMQSSALQKLYQHAGNFATIDVDDGTGTIVNAQQWIRGPGGTGGKIDSSGQW